MKKRIISFLVAIAVVITSLNLPIASSAATQEDGNLLYGLTATTNNEHINGWYNVERPLSSLTDGNTFVGIGYNANKTFVTPYDANGQAYVHFPFETATTLNKVVVYFPGYNVVSEDNQVRDYVVDVQLENGAWERVAEKHNEERSHWAAYYDTLCFAPITCKNLRITCVNTYGQTSIGFYEIEAYYDETLTPNDYTAMDSKDYTADAIPLPETIDLMNVATFSANNAYNNGWYPSNRPLSKLNDGNNYVGVGYNTGETATIPMESNGTGYVNANFGPAATVNKVDIYFAGYQADGNACNIRDFAIDAKLSDGTWKRVAEQHLAEWSNWDAKKVTLCFDAVKATDVRITFKGSSSVFLYEIDAFHIVTQTPAENTNINSLDYTANAIPLPEFVDLINNATLSANNAYNNGWYNVNRPLSKLNDGNNYVGVGYNTGETATIPMESNGTGYVNANFGPAATINKVDIYFAGYQADANACNIRDFAIDVKLSDGTWKRVAEQHLAEWSNWDAKKVTLCFDAVKTTDVRITFKGSSSVFLYEIDMFHINTQTSTENTSVNNGDYTADAIPFPVSAQNLINNATLSANSGYYNGWYNVERPLSKLHDGNNYVGTGYNTGETATIPMESDGTGYVNAHFGTATTLNKVIVCFAGTSADSDANKIRDFALDVRFQDGTWKRVAEQHLAEWTNWDAKKVTLCFDAVKVTDLRMTMVSTGSAFIYEIEAFDINTQTAADNTPLDTGATIPQPKSADWVKTEVPALDDYAYSFAVVGDTQITTKNDVLNGTNALSNMYQYIIDKKEEYKISQVIGLGDIVDTYTDGEQKEAEWNVALNAIKKLDDVKLPYTLIPGNHDVNWNFNYRVSNLGYLNQSQIVSKYGKKEAYRAGLMKDLVEEPDEPSASNTAHAFTAGGRNYLILTLEYAAISTPGVMDWADKVVKAHPYHNVIVTTHAYLAADGSILDGTQVGSPSSYAGSSGHNNGDYFWNNLISQNDNIVMVLCGHVGTDDIVISPKVRDNGTTVTQIMINPQDLEAEIGSTGMLAFMYFSEDGKTVQLRQYSTVWDRYYGNESQTSFEISVIEPIQGDVNADREVDVRDLVRYKKYVLQADNSVVISKLTSDLNDDTEFDTDDVVVLRKMLVGIEEYEFDSNANKSVVYLSSDGKDTWTGTESQPYGTLDKAIAAVQDNGVIQIQGTYELSADFVWEKHNKTVTISGGVLDGTALGNRISLGDHVTFDNITLKFTENSYLFANGYSLTIKENITMPNRIRVYGGGQIGTTVASTDLKLYGGSYEAVFGGSDGGTVTGNTSVVVAGNVNGGITPKHDATDYFVYGGGVADTVEGNTNVTFGGNAKAHYVFGGSYGESAKVLQGTNVYITGGTISGVYGGGNKGGTGKSGTITGGAYVEMTGGTVDQVFGGNAASDMTGDVQVKILGGTVTRRIYGGCYNEYKLSWLSTYSVSGKITLTLSGEANLAFSYDDADLSVFARSRRNPKSDNEHSYLIYVNGGANYENKMGANDSSAKLMMSGVSAYDSCETQ